MKMLNYKTSHFILLLNIFFFQGFIYNKINFKMTF